MGTEVNVKKIYTLKRVDQIINGDIILHPIFRKDGLLLINRYTKLVPFHTKYINENLKGDFIIAVVESLDNLKRFLDLRISESKEFILDILKVINSTKDFYTNEINIEDYLGKKINLESYLVEKPKENKECSLIMDILEFNPFWRNLEANLESIESQEKLKDVKRKLIEILCGDKNLYELIRLIQEYDQLLLVHSINKLCISLMIGSTIECNEETLIELGLSALFSGVGFLKLDQDTYHSYLRSKVQNELADKVIFNTVNILSGTSISNNKNIIYGIFDQYEYYNGSGVPRKKVGKNISLFGRILAIALAYERLISGYFGDRSYSVNEAITLIWENNQGKLDKDIIKLFMYRSSVYKLGKEVIISNDTKGKIIGFSDYIEAPHKPIVVYPSGKIIDYYKVDNN
ncbi:MAG: HD-GYP domain-containing protein [Clostridiaceae bacterium]